MRYILAVLACLGILLAYGAIAHELGWRAGGGAIPMLLFFAAVAATWKAITKRRGRGKDGHE